MGVRLAVVCNTEFMVIFLWQDRLLIIEMVLIGLSAVYIGCDLFKIAKQTNYKGIF